MAMRRVLTEDEKWRDLVGGFILAFGEIELFTYYLWPKHFPKVPAPHRFGLRVERLLEALEKDTTSNERVIALLKQADAMAGKRNTVAHNPTEVEIYQHTQTGQLLYQRRIHSRRSRDFIDDMELTELREGAEHIASQLFMTFGAPK